MKNGGYSIVDLGGVNLEYNKPQKIEGIHEKIARGTKALLLSGIVINGKRLRDRFVSPDIKGDAYAVPIANTYFELASSTMHTIVWLQVNADDSVTAKQSAS